MKTRKNVSMIRRQYHFCPHILLSLYLGGNAGNQASVRGTFC